jgi:hypothetical protein
MQTMHLQSPEKISHLPRDTLSAATYQILQSFRHAV